MQFSFVLVLAVLGPFVFVASDFVDDFKSIQNQINNNAELANEHYDRFHNDRNIRWHSVFQLVDDKQVYAQEFERVLRDQQIVIDEQQMSIDAQTTDIDYLNDRCNLFMAIDESRRSSKPDQPV